MRTGEWLGLIGTVLFAGWVVSFLVVDVVGFQINPPRNNGSIAFMGAAVGQLIWLACNNKPIGLRGAVLGYVGFGLGMAGGRLLGNVANVLQADFGFTINHWNVMETFCGFIGGFIYCFGMVDRAYPEPLENENISLASVYGIIYALGIIPLWHRLGRIQPGKKLPEWASTLKSYGYSNPDGLARTILWLIDGVCARVRGGGDLAGDPLSASAACWAALPSLWLSGTMLLFQNLTAQYFFYSPRPHYINMHNVFWVMFVLMLVYAAFARPQPVEWAESSGDGTEPRSAPLAWLATAIGALGIMVFVAGFVNNEKTMATATTRWPRWEWRSGPFPGRAAKP